MLRNIPEQMKDDWMVWRLYMEGMLPLAHFNRVTLDGVDLANRLLDSLQASRQTE